MEQIPHLTFRLMAIITTKMSHLNEKVNVVYVRTCAYCISILARVKWKQIYIFDICSWMTWRRMTSM